MASMAKRNRMTISNKASLRIRNSVMIAALWLAMVPTASAQNKLEDALNNNEPAQKSLQTPAQADEQQDSLLSRMKEAIDDTEPASEEPKEPTAAQKLKEKEDQIIQNEMISEAEMAIEDEIGGDSLPKIPTRLKLRTSGFDNASGKNVTLQMDELELMEKSPEELEEEIRREAFDAAITGLFPMQPDQIKQLITEYESTKKIVKEPIQGIPTPQITVATLSLDPGVVPLNVKTSAGHVTTINVLDITGAPWPIQDVTWAGDFEVTEPEEGGHIIRITPMDKNAYGNMSMRLLTLKTPVTIMLSTSQTEVQYRVDARIPEYGPFAAAPLMEGGTERVAGNALITSILDGVPPSGALKMDISGVDGRTTAYNISGMTYVRTPLTLLSPGWEQSVSSADGMNVYALTQTPVLLLSEKGRFMRASLNTAKDLQQ